MTTIPSIRLRAIEPEDLDLLYLIENDTRLWNVGTTNVPYSRYTLHDYIATSSDDIYADRQVRLIIGNEDGQTVGMCDLVHFEPCISNLNTSVPRSVLSFWTHSVGGVMLRQHLPNSVAMPCRCYIFISSML